MPGFPKQKLSLYRGFNGKLPSYFTFLFSVDHMTVMWRPVVHVLPPAGQKHGVQW